MNYNKKQTDNSELIYETELGEITLTEQNGETLVSIHDPNNDFSLVNDICAYNSKELRDLSELLKIAIIVAERNKYKKQ